MPLSFRLLTLSLLAAPALAQAPNTLTPKEARDGWLLLFDGETTLGWYDPDVGLEPAPKKTTLHEGTLILGGEKGKSRLYSTTAWKDFELDLEYQVEGTEALLILGPHRPGVIPSSNLVRLQPRKEGWSKLSLRVLDAKIEVTQDGKTSSRHGPKAETLLVSFETATAKTLRVRNLKLRPLEMKALFNGKDLSGWKVFPDKKSAFTVNDKGELNVKDGPGDLQTEGSFADFVLQLECISNGKHLNSGIFFRCRPGEYQQGYEAQIRNQFTPEPTQDYEIERYDPKTGKLASKEKIKSPAVDYGTGAIYRRVPARKELSKDGEWFTLTVHAQDRHFATWVNGVRQVDWRDNRPDSDNARKGYCPKAGPISIQGHDPTTDLSFRNFRVLDQTLKSVSP